FAVTNAGSGRSNASENLLPMRLVDGKWPLIFKLVHHDKDIRIATSIAHQQHASTPLLALTQNLFSAALHELGDKADYIEVTKISRAAHDYGTTGFHAKTHAEEVKCVDLELNVLMSIEDVTQRVSAAVTSGMSTADAQRARRGVMNTIEKESLDKTGLRSDVITLYQGGEYHLYRYKKYTDVRLVFAPEVA